MVNTELTRKPKWNEKRSEFRSPRSHFRRNKVFNIRNSRCTGVCKCVMCNCVCKMDEKLNLISHAHAIYMYLLLLPPPGSPFLSFSFPLSESHHTQALDYTAVHQWAVCEMYALCRLIILCIRAFHSRLNCLICMHFSRSSKRKKIAKFGWTDASWQTP